MGEQSCTAEQKPPACDVLASIMAENGDPAREIRRRFHPTMVSRWRNARRLPDLQSAIALEKIDDRLAVRLWKLPEQSAA